MKLPKPVLVYAALLLYTVLPIVCVFIAGTIAKQYGCNLDEGGAHPCMAFGRDIGGTLVTLLVSGWFLLITVPTGLIALTVYSIGRIIAKPTRPK